MTDTSMPGGNGIPIQEPAPWAFDIDPASGSARATFNGRTVLGQLTATGMTATSLSLSSPLSAASGGTADAGTPYSTYTPTVTAQTGTFGAVSATGRYKILGKTCFFQANVTITTLGTAASAMRVTLPVQAGGDIYLMPAYDVALGTVMCIGQTTVGSSLLVVRTVAGAFPGASGSSIIISGSYETA